MDTHTPSCNRMLRILRAKVRAPRIELLREQRYRRQFLSEDRRQASIVMIALAAAFCLAVSNDFLLFTDPLLRNVSLASRILFGLCSAVAVFLLRRARQPRQLDRAIDLSLLNIALCTNVAHFMRVPIGKFIGPFVAVSGLLIALYFVLRGRLLSRLLTGASLSVCAFILALCASPPIETSAIMTIFIVLVTLNIIGVLSAHGFEENRRKRFQAERHELLARRELAVQKERAESSSRARAAFVAAMSHEFRTPMNAVIGLSDLLLDAPLHHEHWRHVRTINESARALLRLLNDILDFTKIDAQKIELTSAPFDLRPLAASVVEMIEPQAKTKGLELRLAVSPEVPKQLLGDDARLRQVLVNLVSNAVKFTEKGSISVEITGAPISPERHELSFLVRDTGIGIMPEVISRLFRPFEQADVSIGRRHGGSGLGLAISKQIVQAMGGDIRVESEPGRGSTFSFQLRFDEAVSSSPAASPASEERPPLTLLVVDDSEINREVARARLGRLGYRVDLAPDGPGAIEIVSKKEYDVVFMDLRMPDMSGIEATVQILKKLDGRSVPHVIAMTASVFEEDREACLRAGMSGFVGKPIDLAQIDAVLRRVAKERAASSPAKRISSGPISIAKLRELHPQGDRQFFVNLGRLFLSELDKRLPRMNEALTRSDFRTLEDDAHLLKSTSAALGAAEMAELCARIEIAAHANQLGEIPGLFEALQRSRLSTEHALLQEL